MRKLVWLVLLVAPAAVADDDLEPYPPAEAGYERMVFRLPAAENENDHKVEVMVGKTMEVDCNQTAFRGSLESQVISGWGYTYYRVPQISGPVTTLMACPEDEKAERFVSVRGEGFLLRYNSRLPVVVYVPSGFEVRYRVWSPGEDVGEANPE